MKNIKSFFIFIGVLACGLFLFYFNLFNNENVNGGGHKVQVINMNVFSEKLREILRKSPKSVEEIVNEIASLNENGDGNSTRQGKTNGEIGDSKSKTESKATKTKPDETKHNVSSKVVTDDKTKFKDTGATEKKKEKKPTEDNGKKNNSLPMCSERGSKLGK